MAREAACIFTKSLIDLGKARKTAILMLLGVLVPVGYAVAMRPALLGSGGAIDAQTENIVSSFITISFIWTAGIFLATVVSASGAASISNEVIRGTMLTLVSKPIRRWQIVIAKLAALAAYALLLEGSILILSSLLLCAVLGVSFPVLAGVFGLVPWLLLYSLVVILVFACLSVASAAVLQGQIRTMVVLGTIILIVFFSGALLSASGIDRQAYKNHHVYIIDPSYHLGTIFLPVLEQARGGMPPAGSLKKLATFCRTFEAESTSSEQGWQWYQHPPLLSSCMAWYVSLLGLMTVSGLCLYVTIHIMYSKDIQ